MTVAAISSAFGNGAIGVVRMTGSEAFDIANRAFAAKRGGELPTRRPTYGTIYDSEGAVDNCVILLYNAPNTYSGEDMVEIFCHGGVVVTQAVLEALLEKGASLAPQGEFTRRAFLNGKLDLAESEGVIDLINANSKAAMREAHSRSTGALSEKIRAIRGELIKLDADIMAYIDYSEEGIGLIERDDFIARLTAVCQELELLIASCERGRVIREGAKICILGKPNVGKSTLLNAFAGYERCIVTEIAGTTRDVVEHGVSLGGLYLRLLDTAGLRESDDEVEKLGILRSRSEADEADIVFAVFDGSAPMTDEDRTVLDISKDKNTIYIINKSDIYKDSVHSDFAEIANAVKFSGKTANGIEEIAKLVENMYQPKSTEALLVTTRHKEAAKSALSHCQNAFFGAKAGELLDMLELDIRNSATALGEITGDSVSDDVIEDIFARFCVGK